MLVKFFFVNVVVVFFPTVVPSPVRSTVALSSSVVQETDKPPVTGMVKLSKVDLICITTSTQ